MEILSVTNLKIKQLTSGMYLVVGFIINKRLLDFHYSDINDSELNYSSIALHCFLLEIFGLLRFVCKANLVCLKTIGELICHNLMLLMLISVKEERCNVSQFLE